MNVNDRIIVEKGCQARGLRAHCSGQIVSVTELGPEYSHAVRVQIRMLNGMGSGKVTSWYVRHINRLSDALVSLNDGNPLHKIVIRRR